MGGLEASQCLPLPLPPLAVPLEGPLVTRMEPAEGWQDGLGDHDATDTPP